MRVTNSMVLSSTLNDLNRSLSRLQDSQTRLSTGRTIRRPSDDPTGASSAMTLRSQIRRSEQHQRAADDAQSWLATADTAIVSGLDVMTRVKELVVRASNSGSSSADSRTALSAEIGHLREELLALANTEYLGRPVFNGTAAGDAYAADGTYTGDSGRVIRQVSSGIAVDVNVTGPDVFGDPAASEGDLFAVLERVQAAMRSGDTDAIAIEHAHVDAAQSRMAAAAAQVGSRSTRVTTIQHRLAADDVTRRESLASIEDADLAEALISVKARENAYTASLQAASKVIPPSLVDYIR